MKKEVEKVDSTTSVNLPSTRSLERRAWGRVFQDGIWDIYLGALFLNAAMWMVSGQLGWVWGDSAAPPIAILLAAYGFYLTAKKRITAPRLGLFKIERKRTNPVHLGMTVGVAITLAMVVVTILANTGAFPEGIPLSTWLFLGLALQAVVMMSLAAYYFGVARFYLYALMSTLGVIAAEILIANQGIDRGWSLVGTLGVPAVMMIPIGIVLLFRFLSDYPLQEG